ncbi:MAG: DUF6444 domain-containing protein, partial [Pseudonocardiaceae bacterium]
MLCPPVPELKHARGLQATRIDERVARMEELERQAGRSSRNSSLPPSRDSADARRARPK